MSVESLQAINPKVYFLAWQYDLAEEVIGMLLEMDNLELLLLLVSPVSLAIKVEEAVQVLKSTRITKSQSRKLDVIRQKKKNPYAKNKKNYVFCSCYKKF